MKFKPLGRMRPKPVALIIPGHRRMTIHTVDGPKVVSGKDAISRALSEMGGHLLYVPNALTALRYTTGALSWSLSTWRGRGTRMTHTPSGSTVTSLRGTLDESPDQFGDLLKVLRWAGDYGVGPGSISAMALNLWRASLSRTITIGFDPQIGRSALYGGRQEIREPRLYQHMAHADIRAAYPVGMAHRPYALSLRSVPTSTRVDREVSGLVRATVYVPSDMPFGPLPRRLGPAMITFSTGPVTGTWPWCELAAALDLGLEAKIHEVWAPKTESDLFGGWWPMVVTGRDLPGAAGVLAKAIANSLWGQFGMVGEDTATTYWTDDKGDESYEVREEDRGLPHAWCAHIAAETTGRVRTRMLSEGLYGGTYQPVHVDTDGIIVRKKSKLPDPSGSAPGDWRLKATMPKVDIRAPQLYRWTCGKGCGVTHPQWHYQAAGVPAELAANVFERTGGLSIGISYLSALDAVLPGGHSTDTAGTQYMIEQAKSLGVTQ